MSETTHGNDPNDVSAFLRDAGRETRNENDVMSTGDALEIVYELAHQNALDPDDVIDDDLRDEALEQQEALDVVHDFIANNFAEIDEKALPAYTFRCPDCKEAVTIRMGGVHTCPVP